MQVQGTDDLLVTIHFEWSFDELYEQVSNPLMLFMDNDLIFIALHVIKRKMSF